MHAGWLRSKEEVEVSGSPLLFLTPSCPGVGKVGCHSLINLCEQSLKGA